MFAKLAEVNRDSLIDIASSLLILREAFHRMASCVETSARRERCSEVPSFLTPGEKNLGAKGLGWDISRHHHSLSDGFISRLSGLRSPGPMDGEERLPGYCRARVTGRSTRPDQGRKN